MAGGAKIQKAAKKVQGLIGSFSGDANAFTSALGFGGGSNKFDQRLKDGLSDLLGGALGIRMSQVPEISGAVLVAKEEARLARQKAVTVKPRSGGTPPNQTTLQFPMNYFSGMYDTKTDFPNSIHFRTLLRKEQDHSEQVSGPIEKARARKEAGEKVSPIIMQSGTQQSRNDDVGSHGSVNPAEEDIFDIFLHLPEKIADAVTVEYSEAKAGMMQQFFARLFGPGGDEETEGSVSNVTGKRNFDANELMQTFKDMMPGGEIIQKAAGHMTNPMVFQTLKNVTFREYAYSFQLKPTSPQEAEMIRKIVFAFKKSMLPGTAGENNMIWTLPNEWAIQFNGPIADWVDFPLTAVCKACTVDYSQYLMAGDSTGRGRGAPGSITLAVTFVETAQLSRQRFEWEVGAGSLNRVSRAEEGTKLGVLSRLKDEDIKKGINELGQGSTTEGGNHGIE